MECHDRCLRLGKVSEQGTDPSESRSKVISPGCQSSYKKKRENGLHRSGAAPLHKSLDCGAAPLCRVIHQFRGIPVDLVEICSIRRNPVIARTGRHWYCIEDAKRSEY